jgi:hypothetical protein
MWWRSARSIRSTVAAIGAGCAAAALVAGCQIIDRASQASGSATISASTPACNDLGVTVPDTYRTKGKELVGDVDGDGSPDRVTLRADATAPARCRHVLVVEPAQGSIVAAPVKPLAWPGTNPKLLLLAEIDGRAGLEVVVTLSPANVFRPGAVFTLRRGELARMRVERRYTPDIFPFYDEFPAGVDCAGEPGSIVLTLGDLADRGRDDSHWDITRAFYDVAGTRFELIRKRTLRVEVGPEAKRRWPEVRGRPFLSCPNRVD